MDVTEVAARMLTVHVCSFSYHRGGVPPDDWGHGGGFVFDCRALPNPGREERYKALTGVHPEVVAFFEREPLVSEFLQHVVALIELARARYNARGFERLAVAFGCTGGQHRSVYCAEWLRRSLSQSGGDVSLRHLAVDVPDVTRRSAPR